MSIRDMVATDLVISPLGADAAEMLDVARCAEDSGYDGLWTLDHFSGTMLDRPWSREPFTVLGAMAAVTTSVRVGPLVANVVNRHPSLLASAVSTLQSVSGGRAVLGVGSGAVASSRFSGEHDAIDRGLDHGLARRRRLRETIEVVRLLWAGGGDYDGEFVTLQGLTGVVGPEAAVPIIVGASGTQTVRMACRYADGVNIRVGARTLGLLEMARHICGVRSFDLSIWDDLALDHGHGGDLEPWIDAGVTRRTLAVAPPFDLSTIAKIGKRLNT